MTLQQQFDKAFEDMFDTKAIMQELDDCIAGKRPYFELDKRTSRVSELAKKLDKAIKENKADREEFEKNKREWDSEIEHEKMLLATEMSKGFYKDYKSGKILYSDMNMIINKATAELGEKLKKEKAANKKIEIK